ncbi:uncharacterized protein LOC110857191 [Folsomia candida]|uniref:uncharacterized protein LOC110857191 n=1 Tax=Folsomia candida TaxID=158441 RepID=UPI00160556D7|nr:uncharacterized protein LOC110857191 [Folsomia candida]
MKNEYRSLIGYHDHCVFPYALSANPFWLTPNKKSQNNLKMLVDLSSSAEIEWKSLNYLSSCKKCWSCLTTNGDDKSSPTISSRGGDKVLEHVLRREPTFRHILLLLTTCKNEFHLDMDDFFQNCCVPCAEIFQDLVLLQEQLQKVDAKICTYFEMLKDKRKNKSMASSSPVSNSLIDVEMSTWGDFLLQ